jgi:hypothetical protein
MTNHAEKLCCPDCGSSDLHEYEPNILHCSACDGDWDKDRMQLRAEISRLTDELARSKMREFADVTLPDGRVVRFVTPETQAELAALQDRYADIERALWAGETCRCSHQQNCSEISRLAALAGLAEQAFQQIASLNKARYLTYTNREAGVAAARRWDAFVEEELADIAADYIKRAAAQEGGGQ